jgi:hypothetical protein
MVLFFLSCLSGEEKEREEKKREDRFFHGSPLPPSLFLPGVLSHMAFCVCIMDFIERDTMVLAGAGAGAGSGLVFDVSCLFVWLYFEETKWYRS